MTTYEKEYWEGRYADNDFPWDLGRASPPLQAYIEQIKDKTISILIPGAGFGYEAAYLYNNGFYNFKVIDWSEYAVRTLFQNFPYLPAENVLQIDFFQHRGDYDLILEQTFFCALPPDMRTAYVDKMRELLKENGKLVGVLFDFPLSEKGPPFGGSLEEYRSLLAPGFEICVLERCFNSVPERAGKEFFLIARKNSQ
jgi:thiopurine S-methyltransferase